MDFLSAWMEKVVFVLHKSQCMDFLSAGTEKVVFVLLIMLLPILIYPVDSAIHLSNWGLGARPCYTLVCSSTSSNVS